MTIEPNDTIVDSVPDSLDDFSDLMYGKKPAVKEEVKEDVDNDPVDKSEEKVEEDQDQDADDKVDEPDDKPEKPKKKNTYQDRINELTAKAREAERALAALKEAQDKPKESTKETLAVVDDGPTPNDTMPDGSDKYPLGEFDPNYIRDMARHTIDKEWNARKSQEQKELADKQVQEARNQLQTQWVDKLTTVSETHEDFLDKTMELEDTFAGLDAQYSDYLVQTIKSLDHGPEVLYYFANNLTEAQKFVKMGPLAATLALGEYNAMFKGQTRQPAKMSKAPPPPQVNKGTNTRKTVAPDTDDLDAFSKAFFKK